ncbi:LysR family transcriptional regulator [Variovorax sp. J22R133]|uniref:LysR family transcriptional regulator n=1 Tax=Variovorax brevis TaxID=3053503 RepID=UPI0025756576|nr:LysR family transcriptional regulator [Variovorax sp. J22R133]MDM0117357.1 LysR family transcriptional regulator [Variovorax sp. J22R133]
MPNLLNQASVLSLRCFVAVVDANSFSVAARQLRMAPSSVTKHVQLLERATGAALVHRTTRRISVTEAGEAFYARCVDILEQLEGTIAGISGEQAAGGSLRVIAPPSFASTVVAPGLARFLERHPGATVDLSVNSAIPDLVRERIDVAIFIGDELTTKQAHLVLAESPQVLCASPAYLKTHAVPQTPADLERRQCCLCPRFSQTAETWHLRQGNAWKPVRPNAVLLSDNGEALRRACLTGAGIGNFYRFHVGEDLASGALVEVLPQHPLRPKTIYAILPHRHMIRPLVRGFTAFLAEEVEAMLRPAALPRPRAARKKTRV